MEVEHASGSARTLFSRLNDSEIGRVSAKRVRKVSRRVTCGHLLTDAEIL